MSYPKRHPVVSKEQEGNSKFVQRREQMKNLLTTKFRGKFNVTADNYTTDRIIRDEVETFLNNE
jgi:hypothetical protein